MPTGSKVPPRQGVDLLARARVWPFVAGRWNLNLWRTVPLPEPDGGTAVVHTEPSPVASAATPERLETV